MSGLNSAADRPFYPAFFFCFTLKWMNSLPVILTVNPVLMRKGRRPRTWKKFHVSANRKWERGIFERMMNWKAVFSAFSVGQQNRSEVAVKYWLLKLDSSLSLSLSPSLHGRVPIWVRIRKRKQSVTEHFLHFVDPAPLFLFLVDAATLIAVPCTIDGVTQAKSHSGLSGPGAASTKRPSLTWREFRPSLINEGSSCQFCDCPCLLVRSTFLSQWCWWWVF